MTKNINQPEIDLYHKKFTAKEVSFIKIITLTKSAKAEINSLKETIRIIRINK